VKAGPPVPEAPLDRLPRKAMLSIEAPEGLEGRTLPDALDRGVKVEAQFSCRRRRRGNGGKKRERRRREVVGVLVKVRGKEKEAAMLHAKCRAGLADPSLTKQEDLTTGGQLVADHSPFLQGHVAEGGHDSR
jgi:hypothetical protein